MTGGGTGAGEASVPESDSTQVYPSVDPGVRLEFVQHVKT